MKNNGCFWNAALTLLLSLAVPGQTAFGQGALTPPGAVAPTMKTLAQIEPRTDVLTLSGNGNNQFLITQSGSYYLTTNIVGVASKNGINIQADNVTLDLNGFALNGSAASSQVGITVTGPHLGLAIRNGTVFGWGGNGITAGSASDSEFDHLRVMTNGSIGMKIGSGNTVSGCIVIGNLGDEIDTSNYCNLSGCNGSGSLDGNGFTVGANCTLRDCTAGTNAFDGIVTADNCTVSGCNACGNLADDVFYYAGTGIYTGNSCTIENCNGSGNADSGIQTRQNCLILGCAANGNFLGNGFGIFTSSGCTIKDCNFGTNQTGIYASDSANIRGCTAYANVLVGITTGNDCVLADCLASANGNGFEVGSECTVNDCVAAGNSGDGIQVQYSCLVVDNTTASNSRNAGTGSGIHALQSGNRIEGNNSNTDRTGISADATENFIIHNTVRSATVNNYKLVTGNLVGTIVNATASGAITGSSGGSGLGTSDPNANFSF